MPNTAGRATVRGAIAVICVCLLLWACDRSSRQQPETRPAERAGAATTPRDWVLNPQVAESEVDAACPRLLSAAPNVTEICAALGLIDCLVGRTRFCDYPPQVASVRSIGDLYNLNVEVLLELRPDLILISGQSRSISERLSKLGLAYEALPDYTLDELFIGIERVGVLTGRPETARRLIAGARADLEAVAARYAGLPSKRVLVLTWPLPDPPTQADAAGPGSFYDDLLRMAGHTNVAAPGDRPFGPISLEFILEASPDVIIELSADGRERPRGDADARRVWSQVGPLEAVARERVHVLVGRQHFILGPRIARTFEALCRLISDESDD